MGSPTRSEQRPFVFLRDGVTLWVKCGLRTLFITIEGLPLAIGSCSFMLGSHARCFCLRLVFPWLGIIGCICAPLIFSGHLFLASHCWSLSHCFFILLSFVNFACCALCLSLPLVFLLAIWVVLRSLCGLLCSLWPYSLVGSRPGGPFSNVSGFQLLVFWGSRGSPLFSFRAPLLSFLPLGASCDVGVPCMPSASLFSGDFVCLLPAVLFLLSRFSGFLARPACLPPCFRSLFLILPRLPLLCLSVGASWCISSYGFVVGWASCFIVLCCGCCLFIFLVFTSCYRFVVLFSAWCGFARVL